MKEKKFGETVRTLRESRGISLRKFAKIISISSTYLSKIERDEYLPPSEEKIIKIAKILGQDYDELLALAGKISSDLPKIILKYPKQMAALIRSTKSLPVESISQLTYQILSTTKNMVTLSVGGGENDAFTLKVPLETDSVIPTDGDSGKSINPDMTKWKRVRRTTKHKFLEEVEDHKKDI